MSNTENLCVNCMTRGLNPNGICVNCGANSNLSYAEPHQLPPRTVLNGKYLIGKVIGEGGFGITYVAWDTSLSTKVAVKEYYPNGFVSRDSTHNGTVHSFGGDKGAFYEKGREQFIEEAQRLAKFFGLPGIVAVKDFFTENGTGYIVMEFVEGATMKAVLDNMGGRMPEAHVLEIMKPLIRSLAQMHRAGVIHRDISPDNIMIQPDGSVKLLDFGAARDASTDGKSTAAIMKHGYAPEEQYDPNRTRQGPWTDVYSVCATIYRAIEGITPPDAITRLREDTFTGFNIPVSENTNRVVMKGLALLPKNRMQDMDELARELYPDSKTTTSMSTSPYTSVNRSAQVGLTMPAYGHTSTNTDSSQAGQPPAKKNRLLLPLSLSGAAVIIAVLLIFNFIIKPNNIYNEAQRHFANGMYTTAFESLQQLSMNYKDVNELYPYFLAFVDYDNEEYEAAAAKFDKLGRYKDSARMKDECIEIHTRIVNEGLYAQAMDLMERDGAAAKEIFISLGDFGDSADKLIDCDYYAAVNLLDKKEYAEAYNAFKALDGYRDSETMLSECTYRKAIDLFNEGEFDEALQRFSAMPEYKDSAEKSKEINYIKGMDLFDAKDYGAAYTCFINAGDYEDADVMQKECRYQRGKELLSKGSYTDAAERFSALGDYKDSKDLLKESWYQLGKEQYNAKNYKEAINWFSKAAGYKDTNDLIKDCNDLIAKANAPKPTTPAPKPAQDVMKFTLYNNSNVDLRYIYISPVYTDSWEENILGSSTLKAGSSINITLTGYPGVDYWDLKFADKDGGYVTFKNIKIRGISTMKFYKNSSGQWEISYS